MNPTSGQVHIDQALTNFSKGYSNKTWAAQYLFPRLNVQKSSDKYFIRGNENLRRYKTYRAPGTESNEYEYKLSNTTYQTNQHSMHGKIIDEIKNDADAPINLQMDLIKQLKEDVLLLDYEYAVATIATTYTNFGDGTGTGTSAHYTLVSDTPGDMWDSYGTSHPIVQVDQKKSIIRKRCHNEPNVMIISDDVFQIVRSHPDITSRINPTRMSPVSLTELATLFDIPQVIVGSASYVDSAEGQTETVADIWTKVVVLAYCEQQASLWSTSFGKTFYNTLSSVVKTWREEKLSSDIVEVTDAYDTKVVDSYAGYLLAGLIS